MAESTVVTSTVAKEFTFLSFLWRFVAALVLILATYNPSGTSFFHWVREAMAADTLGPVHFFVGVLLIAGWSVLLIGSFQAMGKYGMLITGALIGTFVWLLTDWGVLDADSTQSIVRISLVCLAALLTVGLSWAHIWRRLTGQFDTDD